MKLAFTLLAAVATSTGICRICEPSSAATNRPLMHSVAVATPVAPAAAIDTAVLHVEGMTCGGCIVATRKVLERLDGVTKAEVSYDRKRAVVTYDPAKVSVTQMIAAIATLHYTATIAKS